MGIGELKRDIRERIITYQYQTEQEDIWELLDSYDRYLETDHTTDELAEAAFLRGDAAFHMGRYDDTVYALTKSLSIEKSPDCTYLEADAYNMLGMLFSFVGYEDVALDNYLSAIESAKKARNVQGQVSALLNAGILYEGLKDYRRAMVYYRRGHEVADGTGGTPELMLVLLCMIQEAQLLLKMQQYEEAQEKKKEIDSYYQIAACDEALLPKYVLDVRLESWLGNENKVQELVERIRQLLIRDDRYLEQVDFYVEFCAFLMESGRKTDAKQFLDMLTEKMGVTEFLHLRMRMEELQVQYHKQYSSKESYLRACVHYMELQQEYERAMRSFKRQNLRHIESLQELESQRQEFEFRSKCDLATGLLNKDTFRFEVENYLTERNRDIMDGMVVIDIDNFKLINDSFGHLVGDEVIVRLAEMIKEHFDQDICGRFGGDEFMIFIRQVDNVEQIELRVEKLREEFAKLQFGRNGTIHNTVSIGVSYNHGIHASYNTMFTCADEALVKAKEYGKNRVAFFEIKRGLLKYV